MEERSRTASNSSESWRQHQITHHVLILRTDGEKAFAVEAKTRTTAVDFMVFALLNLPGLVGRNKGGGLVQGMKKELAIEVLSTAR